MITGGRIQRGCKLQVWLSHGESTEWHDAEFQTRLVTELKRTARSRGRPYLQIYNDNGEQLLMTDSAL